MSHVRIVAGAQHMSQNNLIPELDNWKDIENLLSSDLQSKREQGIGKALQNVTIGIVNSRFAVSGLKTSLGSVREQIEELNKNITATSDSSGKLTEAIKNITLWGTIIAAIGVTVALLNFCFEIYKYFIK